MGYIQCVLPLHEKAVIARIRGEARRRGAFLDVTTGIGDDCAMLRIPPGCEVLITTDFSVENIHFKRAWHPAESVGHRCLARGLSDIAAWAGSRWRRFFLWRFPETCLNPGWTGSFEAC
jgi:thiamine-monophosphate kinase